MNKQERKNFKKRNLRAVWQVAHYPWVNELYNLKFLNFLRSKKWGERFFYKYLKLRFRIKRKPVLPLLEYIVTTRCTMNCRECNTKIPEYNKNGTHVNIQKFDQFKKDLDTLLKAVDYINFFGFVGGEPLLSKELPQLIEYAKKQRKIKHIFIASNATILPSKELIDVIKNNKNISVQVSDYRNVKNIKSGAKVQYDETMKIYKENHVQLNNYQEKRGATTWFTMPKVYVDKQDPCKIQTIFNKCFCQHVNMFCDGKIHQCMLSLYAYNNLSLPDEMKAEVIDVRNAKSPKELTQKIIAFFSKPHSGFCHCCHFDNIKEGLPCGEQVE